MSKIAVVYWSGTGNTEAMACDFVICNESPDDDAVASCKTLGAALV